MLSYSTRLISIRHVHLWRPPTDIYETETQLVVQIEIAGMRDGDVSILLQDRRLTVSGVRHEHARERHTYHQMEINSGEFKIEIELPLAVSPEGINAEYEDGFLKIAMRKF
ncbi:MAG: Hsp20/alpha crystallin family protein [Chloroflexota bacterium]